LARLLPDSADAPDSVPGTPAPLLSFEGLCDALRSIVADVTRATPAAIALDQPLRDLGVDSLMTLQIRDRVGQRFGVTPRITDFWSYPTVASFARHLAARLAPAAEAGSTDAPAPVAVNDAAADKWARYL
jgi:acyl carrier protein